VPNDSTYSLLLLLIAFLAANLVWFSERFLFLFPVTGNVKPFRYRFMEWLLLYLLVGALAYGLEHRFSGQNHTQSWEFYVTTFCLFVIFSLPGFLYHTQLKKILSRRR